MARSHQLESPPSEDQVSSQAIWSFPHHQRNIRSGVSAVAPSDLANPRCLPRLTLIRLSRERRPWPKLLPTITRTETIQCLTPPLKPSTPPSNSRKGTSSSTLTPQLPGTPRPSTPLPPGTTPPKIPSLDAAIAYALQSVLTKTTTYSTAASAKTSTAPYTTRKCPTTLSRWRPNLPLPPPTPSINDPFQNDPSPCPSLPSQHSSPSPWPMATKKPSKASPKASSPPSKNTPKKSARPM